MRTFLPFLLPFAVAIRWQLPYLTELSACFAGLAQW